MFLNTKGASILVATIIIALAINTAMMTNSNCAIISPKAGELRTAYKNAAERVLRMTVNLNKYMLLTSEFSIAHLSEISKFFRLNKHL